MRPVQARVAVLMALGTFLVACPKKPGAEPDAAAEASVPAATTETADSAPPEAPTAAATTAPAGGKTAPRPIADAGADARSDAGVVADAGPAAQECCCEVSGQPLASVAQSECVKTRKGQCVKKERCTAAVVPDAGTAQTCCCDAGGKKEIVTQSSCAKERKGKCVKMTECK
jgi:hypothetical protein